MIRFAPSPSLPFRFAAALVSLLSLAAAAGAADIELRASDGDVVSEAGKAAQALRFSKQLPGDVEIMADKMTFDYKKGTLVYLGHVRVVHEGIRLGSDRIDVLFEPGRTDALRSISASGHVEVIRGDETASGDRALYEPGRATLVLTGNARLGSGRHRVEGERVVVYIDEGRAVVEGGTGPVRARIVPSTRQAEELIE